MFKLVCQVAVLLISGLVLTAASVLAQSSGGEFQVTKSTIDAGGGASSGGEFELTGTIGQPEADSRAAAGGEFVVAGGFWANAEGGIDDDIFSDGFEEN